MPFNLSRGGKNIVAEVQRWQYFLRRMGIGQAGAIDGNFGLKTETGTKIFQVQAGLAATGKAGGATLAKARELGYTILPDDHYQLRGAAAFPPRPAGLESPSGEFRNKAFTCFRFVQRPLMNRPDAEAITIKGSCDSAMRDWTAAEITEIAVPQLRFARGFGGRLRCHRLAAPLVVRLFEAWEAADLLHLVVSYEGCFVPRYKRGQAPGGAGGHSERRSAEAAALSNHAFGSAFDINAADNRLGAVPALCGRRGSTRELVEAANAAGFFWGGHFGSQDGMHFEIGRV